MARSSKKAIDDEVEVMRLALLTADRTRGEQASMKRVAKRLERRWNAKTVTNIRHLTEHGPISLYAEVEATWERP